MSRHTQTNPQYTMAYGKDDYFGLFVQIIDNSKVTKENDGIIVDIDARHNGLTPAQMIALATEYGFSIEEHPEEEIIKYE